MSPRTDHSPRRRLEVERRRDDIMGAARDAYAAAPYSQVLVADIARAAGASPALVFHYFGSKAGLYAAVVEDAIALLARAQQVADEALSPGVSSRDRVRTSLLAYLDHIATHPATWATPLLGGEEPTIAVDLRRSARERYVDRLRELLELDGWERHEYAVWGYFGFLDQACLRWVERSCPESERHVLVDAALGALEGALGDWGS